MSRMPLLSKSRQGQSNIQAPSRVSSTNAEVGGTVTVDTGRDFQVMSKPFTGVFFWECDVFSTKSPLRMLTLKRWMHRKKKIRVQRQQRIFWFRKSRPIDAIRVWLVWWIWNWWASQPDGNSSIVNIFMNLWCCYIAKSRAASCCIPSCSISKVSRLRNKIQWPMIVTRSLAFLCLVLGSADEVAHL